MPCDQKEARRYTTSTHLHPPAGYGGRFHSPEESKITQQTQRLLNSTKVKRKEHFSPRHDSRQQVHQSTISLTTSGGKQVNIKHSTRQRNQTSDTTQIATNPCRKKMNNACCSFLAFVALGGLGCFIAGLNEKNPQLRQEVASIGASLMLISALALLAQQRAANCLCRC